METYKFIDLHPQSKKNVINRLKEINLVNEWYMSIFNSWNKKLSNIGFNDSIIYWDFINPGNNPSIYNIVFSFDSFNLEKGKWIFEGTNIQPSDVNLTLIGKYISNSVYNDIVFSIKKLVKKSFEEQMRTLIEKNIEKMVEGINQKIYTDLEKEYDFLTDEDIVRATLNDSDMLFDEYGNDINDQPFIMELNTNNNTLLGKELSISIDGETESFYVVTSVDDLDTEYEVHCKYKGYDTDFDFCIEKSLYDILLEEGSVDFTDETYSNDLVIEIY